MVKKQRLGATLIGENISDNMAELYDKYPEFRGKSPNWLVNRAWEYFTSSFLKENKNATNKKSSPTTDHVMPRLIRLAITPISFFKQIFLVPKIGGAV